MTEPFLEDAGGVAINKSIAMMFYVAQKYGPTSLPPTADGALMARVFQLTLFGETEIGMNLNPFLAAHFMAPEKDKRNWSVLALEQRLDRALRFAATLVEDGSYLVGENLILADISVSCALSIWQGALGGTLSGAPIKTDYTLDRLTGGRARVVPVKETELKHC
jgi:glutathione S-transferase